MCLCACARVKQTPGFASLTNAMAPKRGPPGGFWGEGVDGGFGEGGRGCMLIAKPTRGAYSASSSLAKLSAWSTCTPTAHRHHAGAANVSSPQRHSAASHSRSHFEAMETPERARHQLACVRPPPACADAVRLCCPKLICSDVTSHITVTIYPR